MILVSRFNAISFGIINEDQLITTMSDYRGYSYLTSHIKDQYIKIAEYSFDGSDRRVSIPCCDNCYTECHVCKSAQEKKDVIISINFRLLDRSHSSAIEVENLKYIEL